MQAYSFQMSILDGVIVNFQSANGQGSSSTKSAPVYGARVCITLYLQANFKRQNTITHRNHSDKMAKSYGNVSWLLMGGSTDHHPPDIL